MNDELCFLIIMAQISKEWGSKLVETAVKCPADALPATAWRYPREYEKEILALLPEHVRTVGPVVDIKTIFEVADTTPRASCYIDYAKNEQSDFTTITAKKPGSDETLVINVDHPIYDQLLQLLKELP